MVDLEIDSFCSLKKPLDDVMLHLLNFSHIQMALRTEPIILSIGHFDSPTEVHWSVGERLLASDEEAVRECKLILLKGQWTFF